MCTIWEHLTKAYERWHHPFKDSSHSDASSTVKDADYIDDRHCKAHTLSLLENGMFLRIVGEVLEKEVFQKDLLSELRAQAPLEESLKPLEKGEQPMHDKRAQIDTHLAALRYTTYWSLLTFDNSPIILRKTSLELITQDLNPNLASTISLFTNTFRKQPMSRCNFESIFSFRRSVQVRLLERR